MAQHDAWVVSVNKFLRVHPRVRCTHGKLAEAVFTETSETTWCVRMPSGFVIARRVRFNEKGVVTAAGRGIITGDCDGLV